MEKHTAQPENETETSAALISPIFQLMPQYPQTMKG
jgi:hypothetical protein